MTTEMEESRLLARIEAQEERIHGLTREFHNSTRSFSEIVAELKRAREEKKPKLSAFEVKRLVFNGDNPHRWLNKIEMYFRINEIPDAKKLAVAHMCMETGTGTGVENWFDILIGMYPRITWPEFKEEVVARFECASGGLKDLEQVKQRGTVDEYLKEFEMCAAAMVPKLTADEYVSCFQKGLNHGLQDQLKLYKLTNLNNPQELIALARSFESINQHFQGFTPKLLCAYGYNLGIC